MKNRLSPTLFIACISSVAFTKRSVCDLRHGLSGRSTTKTTLQIRKRLRWSLRFSVASPSPVSVLVVINCRGSHRAKSSVGAEIIQTCYIYFIEPRPFIAHSAIGDRKADCSVPSGWILMGGQAYRWLPRTLAAQKVSAPSSSWNQHSPESSYSGLRLRGR